MVELWELYGQDSYTDIIALVNVAKRISGKIDIRIQWHNGVEVYTDGKSIFIPEKYQKDLNISQGLDAHEAGHVGYGTFEIGTAEFILKIAEKNSIPIECVQILFNVIEDVRVNGINRIKFPGFYYKLREFTDKLMPEIKEKVFKAQDLLLYINLYYEDFYGFQVKPNFSSRRVSDEDWAALGKIKMFLNRSLTTGASIIACHQIAKIIKKYYPSSEEMSKLDGLKDFYGEQKNLMKKIEEMSKKSTRAKTDMDKICEEMSKELESIEIDPSDLEYLTDKKEGSYEEGKDADGKESGKDGKDAKKSTEVSTFEKKDEKEGDKGVGKGKDEKGSDGKEGSKSDKEGREGDKKEGESGSEGKESKDGGKGKAGEKGDGKGVGKEVIVAIPLSVPAPSGGKPSTKESDASKSSDKDGSGLKQQPDVIKEGKKEPGVKECSDHKKEGYGTIDADNGGSLGGRISKEELDRLKKEEEERRKRLSKLKKVIDIVKRAEDIMEDRLKTLDRGSRRSLLEPCRETEHRSTFDAKIEGESMIPISLRLAEIRAKYKIAIARMKELLAALRGSPARDDCQKTGRINSKLARTYASDFQFKKCFSRKVPNKTLRMLIMVDISGSMSRGNKLPAAKTALVMLCDALEGIADVKIVLFTGTVSAINVLVKDFGEPLDTKKIDRFGRHSNYCENLDGISIKHESAKLRDGDFIVVISDGQPAGDGEYGLAQAIPDIQDVKKKFKIFAFSLDAKGDWLTAMYGRFWTLASSQNQSELALKMLRFCQLVVSESSR